MATTTSSHTLSTSYLRLSPTSTRPGPAWREAQHEGTNIVINISSNDGSTGRGILIGMLSAFGSAAFVVLIFAIFYFFKYTSPGRIFLDRIGRPGEYDDEQALAREEAEALEQMDDIQRLEYMRAKGEIPVNAGVGAYRGILTVSLPQLLYKPTHRKPCKPTSHYPSFWPYRKKASQLGSSNPSLRSPTALSKPGQRSSSLTPNAVCRVTCQYRNKTKSTTGKLRFTISPNRPL